MSAPFPIFNGVKQSCVLAPTLFTIFFGKILKQAAEDLDEAIKKVTSTSSIVLSDGGLSNR